MSQAQNEQKETSNNKMTGSDTGRIRLLRKDRESDSVRAIETKIKSGVNIKNMRLKEKETERERQESIKNDRLVELQRNRAKHSR